MARQHGTGTIFQRADGRWIGRYRDGYTHSGNYRYRTVTASTEAKCKTALNAAIRDQRRAEKDATLDAKATVKTWADTWLPREREQVRPNSFTASRSAVTQWIIPTMGDRRLVDLTAQDVRKMHGAIKRAGRKPATAIRAHAVLMKMLKEARREGHNVPGVATDVPAPKPGLNDREAIPVPDALRILATATQTREDRTRWAAALLQGMRQAECLGLTWGRVDLDKGVADVSWQRMPLSWEHGCDGACRKKRGADCPDRRFIYPDDYEVVPMHGRVHWARPKSHAGKRIIPLVPWMVSALREWREVAPASKLDLVWPRADGLSRDEDDDLLTWKQIQVLATVAREDGRRYVLHEARHTTATLLYEAGVDSEIARMIVGHSSMASTRGYLHLSDKRTREALEQVAAQLQLTS